MAAPPPTFANDGSFLDKFKELQEEADQNAEPLAPSTDASEASGAAPALLSAASERRLQDDDPDFQPSTSFAGAREGFVFKTGEQGTGYYKDVPLHLQHKQPKAKPVALKSNSIIKGLPRRTAAGPDPKRQKKDDGGGSSKPSYLKEMERYRSMACSADTKHDRPLVK